MIEDTDLLRRYVEEKAEDAFAELVRRHIDLVYSVALRRLGGDVHLAQDAAQKVFVDLARKAPQLKERAVLTGWLYRSVHFAASDMVRAERRRRLREQESQAMQETSHPVSEADWQKLRPMLDEALGELDDDDRDAVALRFFEQQAFGEIGRRLRLTEEAARKRVGRALDRLGAALSRRGVTSTAAALGLALTSQTLVAAPTGLAAAITGTALSGGTVAAVGAGTGGLFFGFMGASKTTVGVAGAVAVLATGAAFYGLMVAKENRATVAAAEVKYTEAAAQLRVLDERVQVASQRATAAEADRETLRKAVSAAQVVVAASPNVESGPITQEMVKARYDRASELASSGNWAAALPELLWCFDTGMVAVDSYTGVRVSFLTSEIGRMARDYPPAREALRERRDAAAQRMLQNPADRGATRDYTALNRALGEEKTTLALYDSLPASDPRRAGLESRELFNLLLADKRYSDILIAKPYDKMATEFRRMADDPAYSGGAGRDARRGRIFVVETAARNVQALAGAGHVDKAKALAELMLAYDNTPETRAIIRDYAKRGGQSNLLDAESK